MMLFLRTQDYKQDSIEKIHPMKLISGKEVDQYLNWTQLMDDIAEAHTGAAAKTSDMLLDDPGSASGGGKLFTRAAWFPEGLLGVKIAPVFPANQQRSEPLPVVSAVVILFDAQTGRPVYVIEGPQLTRWKTAADSALGARYLARKDARRLLMVGAGGMAMPLIKAHLVANPSVQTIQLWNRTDKRAKVLIAKLAEEGLQVTHAENLELAVRESDIISCATMSEQPVIQGHWLKPGTHLDLVGAYTLTMREADDSVISRGKLFVDSFVTASETGELAIPLNRGVISESDIQGDFYALAQGVKGRTSAEDITVFKNGGGAHLDLIAADSLIRAVDSSTAG